MKGLIIGFGLIIVCVLLMTATGSNFDELQAEQDFYCEQVKLFKESRGEMGWPDYERTYSTSCKP